MVVTRVSKAEKTAAFNMMPSILTGKGREIADIRPLRVKFLQFLLKNHNKRTYFALFPEAVRTRQQIEPFLLAEDANFRIGLPPSYRARAYTLLEEAESAALGRRLNLDKTLDFFKRKESLKAKIAAMEKVIEGNEDDLEKRDNDIETLEALEHALKGMETERKPHQGALLGLYGEARAEVAKYLSTTAASEFMETDDYKTLIAANKEAVKRKKNAEPENDTGPKPRKGRVTPEVEWATDNRKALNACGFKKLDRTVHLKKVKKMIAAMKRGKAFPESEKEELMLAVKAGDPALKAATWNTLAANLKKHGLLAAQDDKT